MSQGQVTTVLVTFTHMLRFDLLPRHRVPQGARLDEEGGDGGEELAPHQGRHREGEEGVDKIKEQCLFGSG